MPAVAACNCGFSMPVPQTTKNTSGRSASRAATCGMIISPCLPLSVPEKSTTLASAGMPHSAR